jgi:hypothetical protein
LERKPVKAAASSSTCSYAQSRRLQTHVECQNGHHARNCMRPFQPRVIASFAIREYPQKAPCNAALHQNMLVAIGPSALRSFFKELCPRPAPIQRGGNLLEGICG